MTWRPTDLHAGLIGGAPERRESLAPPLASAPRPAPEATHQKGGGQEDYTNGLYTRILGPDQAVLIPHNGDSIDNDFMDHRQQPYAIAGMVARCVFMFSAEGVEYRGPYGFDDVRQAADNRELVQYPALHLARADADGGSAAFERGLVVNTELARARQRQAYGYNGAMTVGDMSFFMEDGPNGASFQASMEIFGDHARPRICVVPLAVDYENVAVNLVPLTTDYDFEALYAGVAPIAGWVMGAPNGDICLAGRNVFLPPEAIPAEAPPVLVAQSGRSLANVYSTKPYVEYSDEHFVQWSASLIREAITNFGTRGNPALRQWSDATPNLVASSGSDTLPVTILPVKQDGPKRRGRRGGRR